MLNGVAGVGSDIFAFGVTLLECITGRPAVGLAGACDAMLRDCVGTTRAHRIEFFLRDFVLEERGAAAMAGAKRALARDMRELWDVGQFGSARACLAVGMRCTAPLPQDRPGSMREVLAMLRRAREAHARAALPPRPQGLTVEEYELLLQAMVEHTQVLEDRLEALGRTPLPDGQCVVCYSDVHEGARCTEGHVVCRACFANSLEPVANDILNGDLNLEALANMGRPHGEAVCPMASMAFGPAERCRAGAYTDHEVARWCDADAFQRFNASRRRVAQWEAEQAQLERMGADREQGRRLLQEQIRTLYPNARQCPRCHRGPVINENCGDLAVHHNQIVGRGARFNNQCPGCGFFSSQWREWEPWNGEFPGDWV